jgi:hypothetical protein
MTDLRYHPALRTYKPDVEDAVRRWEAFYAGEIVDRPLVVMTPPRAGCTPPPRPTYQDRVFGDIDEVLARAEERAASTFWAGDAIPVFGPSMGPDEVAVYCGAGEFRWSPDSTNTNWSVPYVDDWEQSLPLRLKPDNPLWQRLLEFYRRAAARFAGSIALASPDLHTNMDLLAAVRGPQRLCLDLIDSPELVDRAMADARAVFPQVWSAVWEAGRMGEYGCALEGASFYSLEGSASLQCDFAIMMSPAMFRRWVLPALEEEAEIVRHVSYHWDGPGALVHEPALVESRALHTLSFVPGDGGGHHIDYLDRVVRWQEAGKAVHVWGTAEECKFMHRRLRPEKVLYHAWVQTQDEAQRLLDWFVGNT